MTTTEMSKLATEIAEKLEPLTADERAKVRNLVHILLDELGTPATGGDKPPRPAPFTRPSGGLSR